MRRLPHCSMTRFQYEPYARRQPSVTRAETTGMYSAKVGTGGRAAGAASRSAGVRPIRSSRSMRRVDDGLLGCGLGVRQVR